MDHFRVITQLSDKKQFHWLSNGTKPVFGFFRPELLRLHPQGIEFRVTVGSLPQSNVFWRLPKKTAKKVVEWFRD